PVSVMLTVSGERNAAGEVEFAVVVAEDLSEAPTGAEARIEVEARLGAALAASQTGTFLWDIDSGRLWGDAGLARLFGLEAVDMTRSIDDFVAMVHPADRARFAASIRRSVEVGAHFDEEFRVVWADGSVHWLWDKGRVVTDADGKPVRMVG